MTTTTTDEAADRAGVLELNDRLRAAWNAHDAEAFGEPCFFCALLEARPTASITVKLSRKARWVRVGWILSASPTDQVRPAAQDVSV